MLYKRVMQVYAGEHLSDEQFFPGHAEANIDRSAVSLKLGQRYGGNFLLYLTELEKAL